MEIWLATNNKGKVAEFQKMLEGLNFEVHGQVELSYFSQPPENGDSFEANARIKARALKSVKPEVWVVADDSGIVVDGLGGLPGIHSARYAGEKARDSENNAKLLKMMTLRSATHRKAHFHCCLVAYDPEGNEHIFQGDLHGNISKVAKGSGGFGYDPIFIPDGFEKTLAELSPGEKNAISHRGKAFKELVQKLRS
ncbi:MAG: RdgB/HAM1 family non-canonical purine NTP pyrophosphatase [Bdellovibrionales bacterium]|nr:RdgB/HAM1 family non-canonical purine NTP pyrophosphatase [Bdellovibrionales bacterium]